MTWKYKNTDDGGFTKFLPLTCTAKERIRQHKAFAYTLT